VTSEGTDCDDITSDLFSYDEEISISSSLIPLIESLLITVESSIIASLASSFNKLSSSGIVSVPSFIFSNFSLYFLISLLMYSLFLISNSFLLSIASSASVINGLAKSSG